MAHKIEDLTGKRFGRLIVIDRADDYITPGSGRHRPQWNCKCDCGNMTVVRSTCLKGGITRSCGCLNKEIVGNNARKHGGFGTRLYNVWDSMRERCNTPTDSAYHNYGGRGITVCREWNDFAAFREWALAAGYDENAPRGQYTLDRIDVNKGYSPDNCRFITMAEQARNKRNTPYYEFNGEVRNLKEWAEATGIKYETLFNRYKRGIPVLE